MTQRLGFGVSRWSEVVRGVRWSSFRLGKVFLGQIRIERGPIGERRLFLHLPLVCPSRLIALKSSALQTPPPPGGDPGCHLENRACQGPIPSWRTQPPRPGPFLLFLTGAAGLMVPGRPEQHFPEGPAGGHFPKRLKDKGIKKAVPSENQKGVAKRGTHRS